MLYLTILVDHFVRRCLPFLFAEYFNHHDISLYGAVHILPSNQKDRFAVSLHIDATLGSSINTMVICFDS
jgi:hypothetical protein